MEMDVGWSVFILYFKGFNILFINELVIGEKIETKECHSCKGAGILYMTETDFSTPIEISPYINPLPLVNPYPLYNPYIYTTWTTNSSISLFY